MLVDAETKALLRDLIVELRKVREALTALNVDDMKPEYDFSKGVRGKYLNSVNYGPKVTLAKNTCDCDVLSFCPKCMPGGVKVPGPLKGVKFSLKKKARKR